MRLTAFALLCLALVPWQASADELVFVNGDRLTGRVVRLEAGKLTFASDLAGQVSVDRAQIASLTTAEPVEVVLSDGQRLQSPLPLPTPAGPLADVEKINPEPVRWHGDLMAGLVVDRGNTRKQDGHGEFNARRRSQVSAWQLRLGYEGAREADDTGDDSTTKRRYYGSGKYDRNLSERTYWYLATDGEHDALADLDLRLTTGPGLGVRLLDGPRTRFSVESGLSWVHEQYGDNSRDDDYLAARFGWDFERDQTDSVLLFHEGTWVPSLRDIPDTQILTTRTGVRADLGNNWFGQAAVHWKLNTEPASGTERQDVQYRFSLGWGF